MPLARKQILDLSRPGWVHCISRCVRRAFLCGDGREHRKEWVDQRLEQLCAVFAAEVAAYAALSNHVHLVVRMDPSRTAGWSAREVARRWYTLFPKRYGPDGAPQAPDPERIAASARHAAWVGERRRRLGDLSWFMRSLNEHIARRANREDGCRGRFWEGRFQSIPLLDQRALVACMVYVDLNPVRAGEAATPEAAAHTGVYHRIARAQGRASVSGEWLAPLTRCVARWGEDVPETGPLSRSAYLELVDGTGRQLRRGAGSIPAEAAGILERLGLEPGRWLQTMRGRRQMCGGAIGPVAARAVEAARRGTNWVKNTCALFAGPAPPTG